MKESFVTRYYFVAGEKGDSGDQAEQSVSRVEFEELSQKMQEMQRNFSQQRGIDASENIGGYQHAVIKLR